MATASASWMPAGRHDVRIGSSLSKALKARKGQQPTQRSKALPERDFYALRYNHKPASIDSTKPGTLEVNPGREVTTVRVERPTVNNNEVVVFKGDENPAKEWECVLIYDEATQTFTLEKLDSLVNLNFDTKTRARTRPTAPSPPSGSSSSAAQTPRRSPVRTAADELEAQLEDDSVGRDDADADADADGEPDPTYMLAQEEEEGERALAAPPPPPPPTRRSSSAHHQKASPQAPQAAQQTKARPTSTKKSALTPQSGKAARVSATSATPMPASAPAPTSSSKPRPRPVPPAPAPQPTSTPITQGSAKRTAAAVGTRDAEDFEIRGPIAPMNATPSATTRRSSVATATAKVPPVAQSQGSSFSLALPSASAGPDPLAVAYQGLYNGGGGGAAASSAGAVESDDEWDEILTGPDRAPAPHHHHHQQQQEQALMITIDDDADDGLDFLERELLGEDEPMGDGDGDGDFGDGDGDEEDDMEEELGVMGHNGPMSMNQFAGGMAPVEDDEDDDYSSSEESDED